MNKPGQFFAFLIATGFTVFLLSLFSPKEALKLGPFELSYYKPSDLLGSFWVEESFAVDTGVSKLKILAVDTALSDQDGTLSESAIHNPLPIKILVPPVKLDTGIQVIDVASFFSFFEALNVIDHDPNERVRVIHYGDSQLEGDRITMQLRDALQKKYGGYGFGYVSLSPLVAPSSLAFSKEQGLLRKTVFGRRDTSVKDMRYGHLASFTALIENEQGEFEGNVVLKKRNWGFTRARNYSTLKLHMDASAPAKVSFHIEDTLYSTRIFPKGEWTLGLDVPLVNEFSMHIQSSESARVFGWSFESPTGIHVDNVAMRGASGMMFTKLDEVQLQKSLQREGYTLIIMQFGGNAVPYLKDEAHAKRFARSMGRQLDQMQKLYPSAALLFIGPSDMARKQGIVMESYPLIPVLRTALRKEVLSRGAGYWDLYDVMGGEGSMVDWVTQDPAFAVKDYIHFTPKGASWVGRRLAQELSILQLRYDDLKIEQTMKQGTGSQIPTTL